MKVTIDLAAPIHRELKALSKVRSRSLGEMASQLLAEALSSQKVKKKAKPQLHWISRPMEAKIDLADKEALYRLLSD